MLALSLSDCYPSETYFTLRHLNVVAMYFKCIAFLFDKPMAVISMIITCTILHCFIDQVAISMEIASQN